MPSFKSVFVILSSSFGLSFGYIATCAVSSDKPQVDTNGLLVQVPERIWDSPIRPLTHNVAPEVIVQMFEWDWDSIGLECEEFLGPAGYGYVQVSPPQEHVLGPQWWTDYQPVSYIIESKRGNRTQFQDMVRRCHNSGVGVLVDAVWNHMTGGGGNKGIAGSSYTKYNYPGIYGPENFHYCGTHNNEIEDYGNRTQVWTCELSSLSDLATNSTEVQSALIAYGNDLISLGVDGFRLDASKHMDPNNIAKILSKLTRPVYVTQEVIYGGGEAVQPGMYAMNGDVQEFRYTSAVKTHFSTDGIANLPRAIMGDGAWLMSGKANVFVSNHDTERDQSEVRNRPSLNYASPSNTYVLAHVFMLAFDYGMPTVLSSYEFTDRDGGAPNKNVGMCSGREGANGWLCQHRWTAIAGMIGFRNIVSLVGSVNTEMVDIISGTYQQLAFGRGPLGFVAINNDDSPWVNKFATSLPDGNYCDVISGSEVGCDGMCTGNAYTVSGGFVTLVVLPRTAIALHRGEMARTAPPEQGTIIHVTFKCKAPTVVGENIFLTGSLPQLSNWSTANAIPLSASNYPVWNVSVDIPASMSFQYKYIRIKNGVVTWEYDPNRSYSTPTRGKLNVFDEWNGPAP